MNYRLCITLVLIFIIFLIICNKSNEYNVIREDFLGYKSKSRKRREIIDAEKDRMLNEFNITGGSLSNSEYYKKKKKKKKYKLRFFRNMIHLDCDIGLVEIFINMDKNIQPGPAYFNRNYSSYFKNYISKVSKISRLNSILEKYKCMYSESDNAIKPPLLDECTLYENTNEIKNEIINLIKDDMNLTHQSEHIDLEEYLERYFIIGESNQICKTNMKEKLLGLAITPLSLISALSGIIWLPTIIVIFSSIPRFILDKKRVDKYKQSLKDMGKDELEIKQIYNKLILAIIFKNLSTIVSSGGNHILNIDFNSEQIANIVHSSTKLLDSVPITDKMVQSAAIGIPSNIGKIILSKKINKDLFINFDNNLSEINIDDIELINENLNKETTIDKIIY